MARSAEFAAIPESGLARLFLDLQKLPVSGTALQIGAHPDDEDNALLAYLSKGLHLNTYYLVANWGEGGQNAIGPELYRELGVLRAQELASARAIDGATQLYLGTYDFGFSKTGAEALGKWGHEECLERLVRFLRTVRPEIVLTHHDPVTGHGQHQAVGLLIREAFAAAADPSRFPRQIDREGLPPWQVSKLYVTDRDPTVQVNVGEYNPVLGRSYHEVGMLARAMHKSQGMAAPGRKGEQLRSFKLVRSAGPDPPSREQSLTDGLDFSCHEVLAGIDDAPAALAEIRRKVVELAATAEAALALFTPAEPERLAEAVVAGLGQVRELARAVAASPLTKVSKELIGQRLRDKECDFVRVVRDLSATSLETEISEADVVPGQSLTITAAFWNRGPLSVEGVGATLHLPLGWTASGDSPCVASLGRNRKAEFRFVVTVPEDALFTDAFDPSPVEVEAQWRCLGAPLSTTSEPELRVVPGVAVALCPTKLVIPIRRVASTRAVSVKLRCNARGGACGLVSVHLPSGWAASGDPAFALHGEGEEATVTFDVAIPAELSPGAHPFEAVAEYDGGRSAGGYAVIQYPHVNLRHLYRPAVATAAVIDVKVAPGLTVGYVDSELDAVPKWLRQLGIEVTLLDAEELSAGDLSRYDTIVTGIRAYHTRTDLVANNQRLLDYVRRGGNLIVQYHKVGEWQPTYAPYPLSVSANRVTREEAPVTVLAADHPFFTAPNRITAQDWDGWIQERGLYFPDQWAGEYQPLVALNDPGEPEQRGSWLVARYGEGTYVYTALAWYRQLDGLVPGAYRLFVNLVSLPKTKSEGKQVGSAHGSA